MRRFARGLSGVVLVMALSAPAMAGITTDDFNDNSTSSLWTLVQDAPAKLWLAETSQRLELRAADPASSSDDALYLSNGAAGFQVKTSSDFTITADYHFGAFTTASGGTIALVLGIGRDLDGKDSAAIGYARSSTGFLDGALGAAYRVADVQTNVLIALPFANSGTFTVSYTAATDRLTLGVGGSTTNVDNVVRNAGQWNADQVWVSLGGRGNGLTLAGGDAYLDNLSVTGDIVPEPATLALLAVGGLGVLLRRRSASGTPASPAR